MSEDPSKGLAEGWEAVTDDSGRTYWWNTETNDTTWEKPVAIVAKTGLAAGGCRAAVLAPSFVIHPPSGLVRLHASVSPPVRRLSEQSAE